jgi:hypothetical protein
MMIPSATTMLSPARLLAVSLFGNLAVQLLGMDCYWSPFQLLNADISREFTTIYVLAAAVSVACAWMVQGAANKYSWDCSIRAIRRSSAVRSNRLMGIHVALLFVLIPASQYSLGNANLINLWIGQATAQDVEIALSQSPLGLHSAMLVVAFSAMILWHHEVLAERGNRLTTVAILLVAVVFLSHGKAQGLVYLAACMLLQQRTRRKALVVLAVTGVGVLIVFFVTRLARNQDIGELETSLSLLATFVLGLYMGSPLANSSYIYDDVNSPQWGDFFYHVIPKKLGVGTDSINYFLPDPTSPSGLVGSGLLLGGPVQAILWLCIVGLVAGFIFNRSKVSASALLFMPFVVVSCGLGMMYDHFINLTFFWMPALISLAIVRYTSGDRREQ